MKDDPLCAREMRRCYCMKTREAAFALRIVRRRAGDAAVFYRRTLKKRHEERLTKVGPISPLAYTAGTPLLRTAVRRTSGQPTKLTPGPYLPLDDDWRARVACYILLRRDGTPLVRLRGLCCRGPLAFPSRQRQL